MKLKKDQNALTSMFRFVGLSLFILLSAIILFTNSINLSSFTSHKSSPPNYFICDQVAATLSAPYVGEVVVVEHGSTDSTPKILQKLMNKYPNIQVKNVGRLLPFSESNNLGYMLSTRPWILPWAGDYFLYPDAPKRICSLIDKCERENIQIVNFSIPRIDGDIKHVISSKVNGEVSEERLFKRGAVMTRQTAEFVDDRIVPLKFQHSTSSNEFFQIHAASFKNAERLYYTKHMKPYLIYHSFEIAQVRKPLPFWDWEYCEMHNCNNTEGVDISSFKKARMKKFCDNLVMPFDDFNVEKWGQIPNYLKKFSFFKRFGLKFIKENENGDKLYRPHVPGC